MVFEQSDVKVVILWQSEISNIWNYFNTEVYE